MLEHSNSNGELSLAREHLDELVKGSAIAPAIVKRAGIRSEYDPRAASRLLGRTPRQWEDHVPVWIVPYRIPFQRDPVLYRGKPSKPFERRRADGSVEAQKYVQPSKSGTHLYFGPSALDPATLSNVKVPLWITEGEKKCLAAESHGLACIAVPGVSQWHVKGSRELHPYLAHVVLDGREVFLCFDADALDNAAVRREELALARALEAAGAVVRIVRLPKDSKGLDDFFVRHEPSELEALIADARAYRIPAATTGPDGDEWLEVWPMLRLDKETDRPIKDVDNIARVLAHHPAWRGVFAYDARWERQTILRAPPFADDLSIQGGKVPRPIADSDAARIGAWFVAQKSLGWSVAPKPVAVEAALELVCGANRFDAVQTYLKGLKWDGMPRLDDGAARYFGAADTPFHRAAFAKWMLSAVARARTPGCQADHVLVLEGPQGIAKSSALRVLAGDAYFSDALPDVGTKDSHEHCVGRWIVELAELDVVRKTEVTALKSFLTARAPAFRHAYARRTTDHPRRCVFAGSSNDATYLVDSTGNRRFWPLRCGDIDLEALKADRDQLWAEALVRVRAGEPWHFTDAEIRAAAEQEQQARRVVDPWVDLVARYCAGREYLTVVDVAAHLGVATERLDQRSANRISAAFRELGWVRKQVRVQGTRVWVYAPGSSPVLSLSQLAPQKPVTPQPSETTNQSSVSPLSPLKTEDLDISGNEFSEQCSEKNHGIDFKVFKTIVVTSDSGDTSDPTGLEPSDDDDDGWF